MGDIKELVMKEKRVEYWERHRRLPRDPSLIRIYEMGYYDEIGDLMKYKV